MKKQDIITLSLILLALVAVRVFFDIPNFNPLGAVALMGGLLFGKKMIGYIFPIGTLLLGDVILGLTSPIYSEYLFSSSFIFVYAAFALIVLIGMQLADKPSLKTVIGGSFTAAILFFLVSNSGSWLYLDMYPKTFAGLLGAYEAGVPFFRNTLVSQLLFSSAIYVVYNLSTSKKISIA